MFAHHALKGQKLLAQGIALGFRTDTKKRPVRAKAFYMFLKLLPLQGALMITNITQGDALG